MRKTLLTSATLLLAVALLAGPAVAGQRPEADIEALAQEMERAFAVLLGGGLEGDPVFQKHGGGLYSLSFPLSPERAVELREKAKPLTTLAAGHMLSDPSSLSTPITAVLATLGFDYNLWWAAVNTSNSDLNRKTTNTVKGPSPNIVDNSNLTYDAMSVHMYWFEVEDTFQKVGLHTRQVKITKAGKVKYKAWAD